MNNYLYFLSNLIVVSIVFFIFLKKNKTPKFYQIEIIGFCLIIISKTFIISYNYELNVDESFHLGNAIALFKTSDIYWKDIDGSTSGPIYSLLTYVFFSLGFPLDWRTIHLIFVLTIAFSWVFYAKIIQIYFYQQKKYIIIASILLPLFIITFNINPIYNQFATEWIPVLLLLISTYGLLSHKYFLSGISIFIACLAKLMVVPLAFFIVTAFVIENFRENKTAIYRFFLGVIFIFSLLVAILNYYQISDEAYWFYIERNIAYSANETWIQSLIKYFASFNTKSSNEIAFINLIMGIYVAYLYFTQKEKKNRWKESIYLILLVLTTLYCIFKSGRNSDHYFILFLFPLFFIFNFVFNYSIWTRQQQIIYLSIIVFLFIVRVSTAVLQSKIDNYNHIQSDNYIKEKAISDYIIKDALKNHVSLDSIRLKVWGWGGSLHVLSGIPQATPNNSVDYETISSPSMRDASQDLVMQHLFKKQPTYFVVKLGEAFGYNIHQYALQKCFPTLDQYIKKHYTVIFNDSNGIEIWKKNPAFDKLKLEANLN